MFNEYRCFRCGKEGLSEFNTEELYKFFAVRLWAPGDKFDGGIEESPSWNNVALCNGCQKELAGWIGLDAQLSKRLLSTK